MTEIMAARHQEPFRSCGIWDLTPHYLGACTPRTDYNQDPTRALWGVEFSKIFPTRSK